MPNLGDAPHTGEAAHPTDPVDTTDAKGPTEWNEGRHGVGPWEGPLPEGPQAEKYDPELLAEGDRRNVVDAYRYWTREAIREDLSLIHI